jgi:hypothetical protein
MPDCRGPMTRLSAGQDDALHKPNELKKKKHYLRINANVFGSAFDYPDFFPEVGS